MAKSILLRIYCHFKECFVLLIPVFTISSAILGKRKKARIVDWRNKWRKPSQVLTYADPRLIIRPKSFISITTVIWLWVRTNQFINYCLLVTMSISKINFGSDINKLLVSFNLGSLLWLDLRKEFITLCFEVLISSIDKN